MEKMEITLAPPPPELWHRRTVPPFFPEAAPFPPMESIRPSGSILSADVQLGRGGEPLSIPSSPSAGGSRSASDVFPDEPESCLFLSPTSVRLDRLFFLLFGKDTRRSAFFFSF